ncbi:MAG: hypothetical protein RL279_121, partial [Pseudomonadota bacterium]
MITQLKNARVFDPAHKKNGVVEDIYISQGRIVAKPSDAIKISTSLDLSGKVVMAGAIDMHSHIGGGKTNIARMLLPEFQASKHYSEPEAHICTPGCS